MMDMTDKVTELYRKAHIQVNFRTNIDSGEVLEHEEAFSQAYNRLPNRDKRKVESLLEKYVANSKIVREGQFEFEIVGVRQLWRPIEDSGYKYGVVVTFRDTIDHNTLLFIPTYAHAARLLDDQHKVEVYGKIDKVRFSKNRIAHWWDIVQGGPAGAADFDSTDEPAYIRLYTPPAYIAGNNIVMYSKNVDEARKDIREFKKKLSELFVGHYPPIELEIENVLQKGCDSLERSFKKKQREVKKEQMRKDAQEFLRTRI